MRFVEECCAKRFALTFFALISKQCNGPVPRSYLRRSVKVQNFLQNIWLLCLSMSHRGRKCLMNSQLCSLRGGTGCSLNIVFFEDLTIYFGLWPLPSAHPSQATITYAAKTETRSLWTFLPIQDVFVVELWNFSSWKDLCIYNVCIYNAQFFD